MLVRQGLEWRVNLDAFTVDHYEILTNLIYNIHLFHILVKRFVQVWGRKVSYLVTASTSFKFRIPGNDRDDLLQTARIGLHKAILSFRPDGHPDTSFSLSQYASLLARRAVFRQLRRARNLEARFFNSAVSLESADHQRGRRPQV